MNRFVQQIYTNVSQQNEHKECPDEMSLMLWPLSQFVPYHDTTCCGGCNADSEQQSKYLITRWRKIGLPLLCIIIIIIIASFSHQF